MAEGDIRTADEPFDTEDLLAHGVYFEIPRTLLVSLDDGKSKSVVFVLGDHYAMMSAPTFKRWADRILRQL